MVNRLRGSCGPRRFAVLAVLPGLSSIVVGLVAFRVAYTHTADNANLVWNLFLAWIPVGFALLLYDRHVRRAGLATVAGLGLLWLLFFPNAPYIVTDFKYLAGSTGREFWFDGALIGTAATTGLLLGFVSLYLLQAIVRRGVGARCGWLFVFAALGLGSFGIYLGRVLRWNSWDIFAPPGTRRRGLRAFRAGPQTRLEPRTLADLPARLCGGGIRAPRSGGARALARARGRDGGDAAGAERPPRDRPHHRGEHGSDARRLRGRVVSAGARGGRASLSDPRSG